MFDAQLYRSREEIEAWRAKDPIPRLRDWMESAGQLHPGDMERLETEVEEEVAAAVAFAEAGTPEPIEELERFVTMDEVPQ
jgi:TPP-dependent pyruvate/acetoin dehydrogenase alpha subunit